MGEGSIFKNDNVPERSDDVIIDANDSQEQTSYSVGAADSQAIKMVKQIVWGAIERRASDIFIETLEDVLRVRYRVDGLLTLVGTYSLDVASSIVSCIKVLSNLDIAEHRFPQDGRFRMTMQGRAVDFRVSVLPANLGEKIVLRVLDKSGITLNLDDMSFKKESIEALKRNLKKPYGMILVCGRTGSGKTTTLYSGLRYIDSEDVNIITVEDPVEYQLEGINQVAVNEAIGMTFAAALRSILRQDPDIVMIGEIRDLETADIAVKASLTGHLVLSTIHTTTATGAVIRFVNMGIEPFLVASSCLMTSAQSLVRKLCPHCKESAPPPPGLELELRANNISFGGGYDYFKAVGCRHCGGSGYSGRFGVSEVMELDGEIRSALIRGETEVKLRAMAIEKGLQPLRAQALERVVAGETTYEEVLRATTSG
jgi:type IV pilus assembly protein PilB